MEVIGRSDLLFVARRWARRGQFTSVERFLDFFPGCRVITNQDAVRRPYRVLRAVAGAAKQDGYTSFSLGLEMGAMRETMCRWPRIMHFLYADHDFHFAGYLCPSLGVKTVATFWFSIEEFERRMPHKKHLQKLDLVFATGEAQRAYLAQYIEAERLSLMPLGVDVEFFSNPSDLQTGRRWAGRRVLQVGYNRRDFQSARRTLQRLKCQFPELRADFVGCWEMTADFSSMPWVRFHELLDDDRLKEMYQSATVLLLPLLEGGSSNALNEAMAMGLPVVATNVANLIDYAGTEGVILCDAKDEDSLAAGVAQLLSNEGRWLKASRECVEQARKFSWARVKRVVLAAYEEKLGIKVTE